MALMVSMFAQSVEALDSLKKKVEQTMVAYELYWFDETDKAHFMGIVREKREDFCRITRESVLDLGRKVMGDDADVAHLYFIQVELG